MTTTEQNTLKSYLAAHPDETDDAAVAAALAPTSVLGVLPRAALKTLLAERGKLAGILLSPDPRAVFVQRMFMDPDYTQFDFSLSSVSGPDGAIAALEAAGLVATDDADAVKSAASVQVYPLGIPFAPAAADVTTARAALANDAALSSLRSRVNSGVAAINDAIATAQAQVDNGNTGVSIPTVDALKALIV